MKVSRALLVLALVAAWPLAAMAAPPDHVAASQTAPTPSPTTPPAVASPAPPPVPAPPGLDVAVDLAALAQISNQAAAASSDERLAAMGGQAAALEGQAQAVAAARLADIAALDRAIRKVAPRRRRPTPAEAAALAPLETQRSALIVQLGQAQQVVGAARGTYSLIAERRREGFSARVLARSDSPVSPQFWARLQAAVGTDNDRLATMTDDAVDSIAAAEEPRALVGMASGLAVALAVLFPLRWWLVRLGRRKTGEAVYPGFARTGAAVWVAAVDAGAPTLAVAVLVTVAEWAGLLSPEADALGGAAVVATAWAASIVALGRVLATEKDPGQRLLRISDADARRLRLPLLAVALVTAAGFLLQRLNYVVGASVAATIAANCVLSLAYAAVAAWILISFGRAHRASAGEAEAAPEPPMAPAWTLIALLLTLAIALTCGAVFAGYTTLAALTAGQMFWLSIIAAGAYLVMRFVDDVCAAAFGDRGRAMRALTELFLLRRTTIRQTGVLVSAALQILVLIGALSLALTPFGRSGDLLFANLSDLGRPFKMGSATISLSALAAGVATFVVGLAAAHTIQRWIVRRYLPATDWDSGLRNSVTTGVGYAGVGLALVCALAATGLGIGQIALIASALSVGIGFGLQQVVQNFVSGVILLVERPVKVGDWVNIGGVEGDIRRIRVRATEIETFDRSTVIVPNSDFITKQVQNKTLGDPAGRILLQLSINRAGDVPQARDLILKVARGKTEIVDQPPPSVFIDSVAPSGAVNLCCFFYVASPRHTYRVRSECYYDILFALEANDIPFAGHTAPS